MADETKDGPPSEPGPPKMATEGARAEAGAAKTDAAPIAERQAAATSETFKAPPSEAAAAEVPAVAGGTNAPVVPPPGPDAAEKAAADAKAEKVAAARAAHAAKLAAEGKPAPAPAPAAAAAKATATPAAAGSAPAPKAGTAKGGDMSRRGFFSWAAVAWVGFSAAIGGCVTAMGRFMFPNVHFEPPTTFKAGFPRDIGEGVVDTRFVDKFGVWLVKDTGRIYALIAIC